MKISGFTFIRNGEKLGYPYIESIKSILPLCDEFIAAVGDSSDETLQKLQLLAQQEPKLRILETQWNESMQDRGFVYAQQKMIAHYNCTGDWAFYLEGDEILDPTDIPKLRKRIEYAHTQPHVEALIFDYYHFFGSPDWIATSPGWYRRAPRIIRNTIRSFAPDGLFFVVMDKNKKGRYPKAITADCPIYHYGHVRKKEQMAQKVSDVSQYWGHKNQFSHYVIDPQALSPFTGKHPEIVKSWLEHSAEKTYTPNPEHIPTKKEKKHRWMMKLEKRFGLELSKKHYKLVT